ncbi:ferritin-like protein [Corynebacterium sp. CMW7794]|uniref:ferritin n=1 Tax=Corynebacterium TaxID=1716 RepID=UPI0007936C89|nr:MULTISPECIES: ferritin [Corynebacterium]KXB56194.1 ferritin-like protein [Corynebacterium sp. DNF00584]KXI15296.1 ferritin-like protein [Corynebacterium sp. CMW7794]MBF9011548.1 ferritin [Corynebacterium phoceense]OFL77518.1 ferritin [Corynebacterium sp. HMSC077B05]OFN39401.1 ferritin [Corynebacterium sp. HMSC072G08]
MNEKLQSLLNAQVINEHGAALIYTQLAYEMDDLSFPGMRDWFYAQAAEEREHAQKIANHLLARGYRVELTDVPVPSVKAATPLDAFEAAYAHEQKVSEQIREIACTADEVKDLESRQIVNWFLDEQIEEEDTVTEIIDQIKLVGNDGSGLLRIDATLGSRAK